MEEYNQSDEETTSERWLKIVPGIDKIECKSEWVKSKVTKPITADKRVENTTLAVFFVFVTDETTVIDLSFQTGLFLCEKLRLKVGDFLCKNISWCSLMNL